MMYLVDTCGWIEWLTNGKFATQFGRYLKHSEKIIVPTIVQFELYKWVCREKNETTALEVIGVTEQGKVIPLDNTLALYAAAIAQQHQLAMADAIIYATSLQHGDNTLITADKHFKNLPNVELY